MKKTFKQKVIDYVERLIFIEQDKWNSGMKNEFYSVEYNGNKIIDFIKENIK